MATSELYSKNYFKKIGDLSRMSAREVAPLVMDLIHPESVVDIGCGTGAWAAAFKDLGAAVLGVDGDYCTSSDLELASNEFLAADLTQPLPLDRKFDLAVCLEVAEHLEAEHADQLVATLTDLAPAVLFSAAIPFQGGLHHVNEQWPVYWVERFASHGFVALDLFRQRLWQNKAVAWWYAQNLLLIVNRAALDRFPALGREASAPAVIPSLVHPACLSQVAWKNQVMQAAFELMGATHAGSRILLVDEAQFGELPPLGREIVPFPEVGGEFAGPPPESHTAIEEVEDQRHRGAHYIAFAWPAFWWLEHYTSFASHLRTRHAETFRSDRWIVFRLHG